MSNNLKNKTIYIPEMSYEGTLCFASAFKSVGINAIISPKSDEETLELGKRYTCGDECYPQIITLGNFLKTLKNNANPKEIAFFMPTATGPCRFGQYAPFLKKVLRENKLEDITVLSPTSENGYEGVGDNAGELIRTFWRALLCGDIIRKLLLKTRPYEINKGDTEKVYHESLSDLCGVLSIPKLSHKTRLKLLIEALIRTRCRFRNVKANYTITKPLIGIVGEIFCRLHDYSNDFLIKKLEEYGCETWMSDIAEWVLYTNVMHRQNLKLQNPKWFNMELLKSKIKEYFQHADEHALYEPFKEDFKGYEETQVLNILEYSKPYLPYEGSLGEMVLSVGKAIYYYKKGADGIIDISPFTCMNGIITEAVFPNVSSDHDQLPIRNFYFDGTKQDIDRDVGIFVELATNYKNVKKIDRVYPSFF
jgi:predicted nucleotide-binding protein (sugar kinase/HSP70/actin superfamily)